MGPVPREVRLHALHPRAHARRAGYDKIALQTVQAIQNNSGALLPLNVRNAGNLPELDDDDTVEVLCTVTANGPLPLHSGRTPESVRPLIEQVKDYERLTVGAALQRDRALAERALARNPLVASPDLARRLMAAMVPA